MNRIGKDILEELYNLRNSRVKLDLIRVFNLFSDLGNPHQKLKFIHIAGTNGKGSLSAIISKALANIGYRVGLFTSPHLISIRERFRVNGIGISYNNLYNIIEKVWVKILKAKKERNEDISFFEANTAIAVLYFLQEKCDFVVWETGLGGRLDATNIVDPIISVITNIGYDHMNVLGETLEEIAYEKGGIIKREIPIFLGNTPSNTVNIIRDIAKSRQSKFFHIADKKYSNISLKDKGVHGWEFCIDDIEGSFSLPLIGAAQRDNLILSYNIIRYLSEKYSFNLKDALNGISHTKWPGRFHILPDGKIVDGAHNLSGTKKLIKTITNLYPNQKFNIIFGAMKDKHPLESIEEAKKIAEKFIFVPIKSDKRRSFSPEELLTLSNKKINNIPLFTAMEIDEALEKVMDKKNTLIFGSLYLAGEILNRYYSENEIANI